MSLLKKAGHYGLHWILGAAVVSALLLRADFTRFLLWWGVLFAVGIIYYPLTRAVFGRFESRGYIFSKIIGTALSGYVSWVLSSLKLLPFRSWALLIPILAGFAVNYLVIDRRNARGPDGYSDNPAVAVRHEALFMLLLAVWSYIRGIDPDIIGLEKFMDLGLVNSMLRSDYFPPPDMWYAGESVNYYYLGQYFAAYLTKLSGISSSVTYNLMMATLFASAFMQAHNIGQFLLELRRKTEPGEPGRPLKYAKTVCGLLTGALVCLSGNLHTVIYAWLFPGGRSYWYPNATRYIGYNPLVETDGTIHEFPHYSYIVSDLHAHVVNLMFVLTVVAASVAVVHGVVSRSERGKNGGGAIVPAPGLWLIVFLIGLFPATNFWDYPIYITVAAALCLYANMKRFDKLSRALAVTLAQLVLIGAVAYAVALPFHLTFESISTSIALVRARSRLYQLLVLYGYQAVFFVILLAAAVRSRAKPRRSTESSGGFSGFIRSLDPGDAVALIFFVCAIGLVILPELVYVVDIYTSHPRANTMFKLTFQAFVLFSIGIGYTFSRLFLVSCGGPGRRLRRVFAAALPCVLLLCAFVYPYYTLSGRYGSLLPREYKGLDGMVFMTSYRERLDKDDPDAPYEHTLNEDYHIIRYINNHVTGQPVIVEANGLSYTSYGRISAFTGLPDIFNWYTHEQLWRLNDTEAFGRRISDLDAIYTGTDAADVRLLLDKYGARYIVIGKLERAKFGARLNE
ncbi:MAG: DUF2298 domain-containing protein, partial [Oscillospiraceae bacterium]|nr:DUF2298 domain-containing protein [Oscillospiraceae bacterium]